MPILDDFAAELVHTITWEQMTGRDADNVPTYAAPQTFKARIDFERKNWVNSQGAVINTTGVVMVGGTPYIQPPDRITLHPAAGVSPVPPWEGLQPPILDAKTTDWIDGVPYYTEVAFG